MYDTNGHLKQVIRVKCENHDYHYHGSRSKICYTLIMLGVGFKYEDNVIETNDAIFVMSTFDGHNVDDILNLLDRRYSK